MAKTNIMRRVKHIETFLRIRGENGATLQEIQDYLYDKEKINLTPRTFLRDKETIADISGITISFKRGDNVYYIKTEELDIYEENIFDNILLIEAYRSAQRKQDIILFEPRKARGLHHLQGIIDAISNKKVITFTYKTFWDKQKISQRRIKPYAIKEFKNRWYLLGKEYQSKEENPIIKTYGLDRISNLEISNTTFVRDNYNTHQSFKNSFGIISSNDEPETIIIKTNKEQGNYIKSLPIHHSQKVVSETEQEIIFSLSLIPTFDFIQEVLSYGHRLQILEPQSLIA